MKRRVGLRGLNGFDFESRSSIAEPSRHLRDGDPTLLGQRLFLRGRRIGMIRVRVEPRLELEGRLRRENRLCLNPSSLHHLDQLDSCSSFEIVQDLLLL